MVKLSQSDFLGAIGDFYAMLRADRFGIFPGKLASFFASKAFHSVLFTKLIVQPPNHHPSSLRRYGEPSSNVCATRKSSSGQLTSYSFCKPKMRLIHFFAKNREIPLNQQVAGVLDTLNFLGNELAATVNYIAHFVYMLFDQAGVASRRLRMLGSYRCKIAVPFSHFSLRVLYSELASECLTLVSQRTIRVIVHREGKVLIFQGAAVEDGSPILLFQMPMQTDP